MKKRIFHISDLHLVDGWHEAQGVVLSEFFKSIVPLINGQDEPYLVFSGDLVQSGANTAHFDEFANQFDVLFQQFPNKHHRICCAGNHDVDRSYVEQNVFMLEGATNQVASESLFNDLIHGNLSSFLRPKFSKFDAFQDRMFGITASQESYYGSSKDMGDVGIYVLNSAILSFGGAKNAAKTHAIDDKRKLNVETRLLNKWLQESKTAFKILVIHHPLDWLTEESEKQLRIIVQKHFNLVLSGHIHEANPTKLATSAGSAVTSIAPALFEAKNYANGYCYIDIDTDSGDIKISYKVWNPTTHTFIGGTSITGTDDPFIIFPGNSKDQTTTSDSPVTEVATKYFENKFHDSLNAYASLSGCWITPQLSTNSEHDSQNSSDHLLLSPLEAVRQSKRLAISAPPRFGLTTLGRFIALESWRANKTALLFLESSEMPLYEASFKKTVSTFVEKIAISNSSFGGIIVETDSLESEKIKRFIKCIDLLAPDAIIIFLNTQRTANSFNKNASDYLGKGFAEYYLTSLSRSTIREIVRDVIDHGVDISEDYLTDRVVSDIDNINIHRTPFHAKVLLNIASRYFDTRPLNMTEVHSLQLSAAILANMPIGTYDTAPDTKDCCYALGLFCSKLIRSGAVIFEKNELFGTIEVYCDEKSVDLDVGLLFNCLLKERIIVSSGSSYRFNYMYWIYFFGAHHMITDSEFNTFVMTDKNYAKYEEMIEYYSGIDRRRSDLIRFLRNDLASMNDGFRKRSNIDEQGSVYDAISWRPTINSIDTVNEKIDQIAEESNLPVSVKDTLADKDFDPGRPYRQELRSFIADLSLGTMSRVMNASAKAIRNSDHVDASEKLGLLKEIFLVWKEIIHATLMISPILIRDRMALFEDILFTLESGFDEMSEDERMLNLVQVLPTFLPNLMSKSLSTKRTGPLFYNFLENEEDAMLRFFAMTQIVVTKPSRWVEKSKQYIDKCHKNSFFLFNLMIYMERDRKVGYNSLQEVQDLEYLVSYIHARHDLNAKSPSDKLVRRVMNELTFEPVVQSRDN
ncbi:MAG: metallophosphoesterase [Mesorhizobium sp.]|nr:MAG: metallophosphoesterase [Mesorhizobium sp.]